MDRKEVESRVLGIIQNVLEASGKATQGIRLEARLQEEGLGLDSLDAATLSAKLERELGSDPYTEGMFPRTVEDVVRFYCSGS